MSQAFPLQSGEGVAPAHAGSLTVLPDPRFKPPRRFSKAPSPAVPQQRRSGPAAEAEVEHPLPLGTVTGAEPQVPAQRQASMSLSVDAGPRAGGAIDRATLLARVAVAMEEERQYALAQFGLDNFRHLNAAAGPEAGDAVLHRFGLALAMSFGGLEIARLGGDAFGVLLPYAELAEVAELVEGALARVRTSDLSRDGSGIRVTASAGIALLDRPDLTAAAALLEADLAMAEAKQLGRNRAVLHDAQLRVGAAAMHEWADRIRGAVENDRFELHAQRVRGLHGNADQWELLVRLPVADGELLPPDRFLPVAQQFGLGSTIDAWVTRRAIDTIAFEHRRGAAVRLEVNVCEETLADPSFVETVEAAIDTAGIDPSALVFEVNGSTAAVNHDDVKLLSERLKAYGCLFAIDGFGAHAGALDQLRTLPLDFVKIDPSFIRHLPTNRTDQVIVRGMTDLAHSLGCRVIAMAVSDEQSVELLESFGVDFVQGFHIERPRPMVVGR